MSTKLLYARDVQGYRTDGLRFPKDIFTATLSEGTAKSITIPSNYENWLMVVRIEPAGWVWVSAITTAAVPGGSSFASATSELITGTWEYQLEVNAGDTISFITPNTTCDISVSLFAIASKVSP